MNLLRRVLAPIYFPLLFSLPFCFMACSGNIDERAREVGKPLVTKYCGNCHVVPDPGLLDKKTWITSVIPAMAEQLGIEVLQDNFYLHGKQSVISHADWSKILKYYETLAPDTLLASKTDSKLRNDWAVFSLLKPKEQPDLISSTMLVAIDTATKNIVTSNSEKPGLYRFDNDFHPKGMTPLQSVAIDIYFPPKATEPDIVTCMGGMRALDGTLGQITAIDKKRQQKPRMLSSEMIRPIQSTPIDFNNDGLMDYAVSAFGHNRGGLYLLKQLSDHTFQKVPVREIPGATMSHIRDFNRDGWPDIITLFAHGDEGIWVFLNDRKGGFTARNLLRFPPVYGSSSFQLADMNHDGKEDIVYTAGDNSDYSRILKPYHGLYIFIQSGNFEFRQSFFYPINGCTKAMVSDFDKDGDIDIATIAFFPDLKNKPEETFTYFEQNNADKTFRANAVPVHRDGRWICMDVNDFDGDGDDDIILGNYSKGFLNQEHVQPSWNVHLPFIVLKNKTIQP
ncbi:FG-GAP repeat domain-containing protein [Dyadobacter pollutisoli]|uniref:VCBS repeat-containing protein n=1 Tax=Dyadobacter pollutisoli TaxID=2910158 RepID=A0A9E8SJJ8_9BACT|nr:VCBS repeat-containing protein [Dyadobacter pollutisoli]WAC09811.1 VCBS repeat-containing protein [Dyadobacter pollutisoli]